MRHESFDYHFEIECCDLRINQLKKRCNMFLFVMISTLAVILMNIPLIYYHTESYFNLICLGMMIMNGVFMFQQWTFERDELKWEMEKKSLYQQYDIKENEHRKELIQWNEEHQKNTLKATN